MTQRNLLFILSDEHQARALSCAGHAFVRTPNLDGLAARGVRFTNAYTTSPICVPARASLATGRWVHEIGYWDNAIAYDGRVAGWGHRLMAAGVRVESIGKLHFRRAEDLTGFEVQHLAMHIKDGIGQVWGSVRDPLPEMDEAPAMLGSIGPGYSVYNKYDAAVADKAVDWLRGTADRRDQRPWLLFVGFVAPHFPLTVPQQYLQPYPPPEMPLPKLRPIDGCRRHPWLEAQDAHISTDAELRDDDERRLAISAYFGLCSYLDEQVGRVLSALRETGLTASTTVVYASDHGEALGTRGRWGKSNLYRESTQIPLIVAEPDAVCGTTCATPVSLIDIAPTFCSAFGILGDLAWRGRSLLDIARAPCDPDRVVLSEYHAIGAPSGAFMLADARWKYHHYVGYPPELFDLVNDPEEASDLAGDPEHRERVRRWDARLRQLVRPEYADACARADQAALVTAFGGREKALQIGARGATPAPET